MGTTADLNAGKCWYEFRVYPSHKAFERGEVCPTMREGGPRWCNNDLTRGMGKSILMGMIFGAVCKYKSPFACLYFRDTSGDLVFLDSIRG